MTPLACPPSRHVPRTWVRRTLGALVGLLALGAAQGSSIETQFALAFPVEAPPGEPIFAIELPAEAYATLRTDGLQDLAIVDAKGQVQSISLLHPPAPVTAPPVATALALPIAVPRPAPAESGRLELHMQRNVLGHVETLDLRSVDPGSANAADVEWLLDTRDAANAGYDAIRIVPAASAGDFRLAVSVLGSDDLVAWTPIAIALPLLRASEGERRIERLELAFPRSRYRYLLLRPEDRESVLPDLATLEALRNGLTEGSTPRTMVLSPVASSDDGRRFDFDSPGPLPIRAIDVQIPDANGARDFQLSVERGDRWVPLANGVAWQLAFEGNTLRSPPLSLSPVPSGRLRLEFPATAPPPRLALTYHPDRVVVVAAGTPPYRLLAGSATYRGSLSAVDALLTAMRDRQGASWEPPAATTGPALTVSGEAALEAPVDPGRIGLWAILAIGALTVGAMAWRLIRSGSPPPAA